MLNKIQQRITEKYGNQTKYCNEIGEEPTNGLRKFERFINGKLVQVNKMLKPLGMSFKLVDEDKVSDK